VPFTEVASAAKGKPIHEPVTKAQEDVTNHDPRQFEAGIEFGNGRDHGVHAGKIERFGD
jgi:hypothetical protein